MKRLSFFPFLLFFLFSSCDQNEFVESKQDRSQIESPQLRFAISNWTVPMYRSYY